MSDSLLQSISNDLVALSKGSGIDEYGYKRIMIPQPQDRNEALEHIKQNNYQKQKSFFFTDPQVINEVRRMHATGKSVWVMLDLSALRFNIYASSEDDRKTVRSTRTHPKTGSEASTKTSKVQNSGSAMDSRTGGFSKLAETERRLKQQTSKTGSSQFITKIINIFRGK